jgi:hypothetical protein
MNHVSDAMENAMPTERYFTGDIFVVLVDGSRSPAQITADEIIEDNKEIYRVDLKQGTDAKMAESEHDFFEALQRLRLQLEKDGALLHCFGASENVYPSGMQRSMGPAILAYRTKIGSPASREDIVNIFEADETVVPATVNQQEFFHQEWMESLRKRR